MQNGRQLVRWMGVLLGTLVVLTGCPYDAAIQRLSPAEQAEFSPYRWVMTGAQEHTYLAKSTAAARTAYLSEIGLAQRFQALEPLDREAVKRGWPRVGMSAEALLFIWGMPYYTVGDARHYAHWHYLGASFNHTSSYRPWDVSTRVDVYLVAGKVVGWVDEVPYDHGGNSEPRRP